MNIYRVSLQFKDDDNIKSISKIIKADYYIEEDHCIDFYTYEYNIDLRQSEPKLACSIDTKPIINNLTMEKKEYESRSKK